MNVFVINPTKKRTAQICYSVVAQTVDASSTLRYTTYGIQATDYRGETLLIVEDVSTKKAFVDSLVKKLELHEVSTLHLIDIIEDFLP